MGEGKTVKKKSFSSEIKWKAIGNHGAYKDALLFTETQHIQIVTLNSFPAAGQLLRAPAPLLVPRGCQETATPWSQPLGLARENGQIRDRG